MARRRAGRRRDGGGAGLSWLAVVGSALLAASTLPQAWALLRTQRADGFGWPFVLLNLAGLVLLALRSAQLGEAPFVAVNALGAAFWALVAAVKLRSVSVGLWRNDHGILYLRVARADLRRDG